MKNTKGTGLLKTTVYCMQQEFLRHLVKIAGLQEITLWRTKKKEWNLSVKVKNRPQVLYLSTRREPQLPRAFKRLDAAIAAGQRLCGSRQFKLVLL